MKIIASWDDGCVLDLRMAELMAKYNIPTIFYWPYALDKSKNMNRCKTFLTMDQCKEIAKNFEIGSHTVNHHWLTKINTQQAQNEIFDSRKLWQDALGQEIKSFCYPRGYKNGIVKLLVKNAGYTSARTTVIGHLSPGPDAMEQPTTVHIGIDRIEYKNVSWEIFARQMLEQARENPEAIFHMMGHSWEIDLFGDWDNLENLLKELT